MFLFFIKINFFSKLFFSGIAAETIGVSLPPTSPIADSNMKQQQERPSNVETGAGTIFIILIVMLSSGVCIYCGFKMCTILHRRRQRGKLHAIGRMTHSDATQTFAGLDSLSSTVQGDEGERYLTANGTRFIGLGVEDPSSAYAAEVGRSGSGGGGGGSGGGGRRDSGSGGAFKEVEMEVVAVPNFNGNFNKKKSAH